MRAVFSHLALCALLGLAACGHRTSSSVEAPAGAGVTAPQRAVSATPREQIVVTEQDITDRPYRALGDISVDVSKWGLLDRDPTRAQIDAGLRDRAAQLGADAVVLVRYGTVGLSVFSWGSLEGRGRAVVFEK